MNLIDKTKEIDFVHQSGDYSDTVTVTKNNKGIKVTSQVATNLSYAYARIPLKTDMLREIRKGK